MKQNVFVVFLLLSNICTAYSQDTHYDQVVSNFVTAYKTDSYESFYDVFSPKLKKDLPLEQTVAFYSDMKNKFGTIISISYYGKEQDDSELYKVNFSKGVEVLFHFTLNANKQLIGFRVMDLPEKKIEVDESIENTSYADLVYSAALSLPNKGEFAIALIDGSEVDYIGLRKNGSSVQVVENKQTIFSLGNFNTVFTATLLAKAINEKKVDVSDFVNPYYDFSFKDSIALSFVSLANHSAFLPVLPDYKLADKEESEVDEFYFKYSSDDLKDYLQNHLKIDSLNLDRRQRFSYVGYALLGDALSRVYNKDFTTLMMEKVFVPYQLKNTSLVQLPKKKAIIGIDMYEGEVNAVDFNLLRSATGGLSTLEDLVKFVQAHFNSKDKDLDLLLKPNLMVGPSFWASLGWKISNPTDDNKVTYFSKAIDVGYCNYVGFSPKKRKGIVVLTNSSTTNTMDAIDDLTIKLMHKLLEEDNLQ
ncbi:MAG: class A beta-lactamase-related serine hydrolase [Flavobacteriaceae bacterium]|jgi:CubicO group peptidase (beta-lactamase class C family)|nr:class A beta-lactamase-related serine hydrolase [Flavobacteriaceae bacterium]